MSRFSQFDSEHDSMFSMRLIFGLGITCAAIAETRADFETEFQAAAELIDPIKIAAGELLVQGRLDDSTQMLLQAFPEKTRTAVQAYLLGNILYAHDPKTSYALHKHAAKEIDDQPNVHLEWAMEQHRAREYAGAAESYARFLKARPRYAPVYGLTAECLIRQGKIKEAVAAWEQSEEAPDGTLERFESLVCDINRRTFPDRERADLIAKVREKDVAAAERLIGLDCRFEIDWWNEVIHSQYLEHDLKLIRETEFADPARKSAILCAGDAALAQETKKGDVADILRNGGFLIDPNESIPESGVVLACMLRSAIAARVVSEKQASEKWGDTVLALANQRRDAELFNVAAYLGIQNDQIAEAQQQGWDITGDRRCAVGRIITLARSGELTLDHPLLAKALKQFPEDSILAGIVLQLKIKDSQPIESDLILAIKAEYLQFSFQNRIAPRLGAVSLMSYFRALREELEKKDKTE